MTAAEKPGKKRFWTIYGGLAFLIGMVLMLALSFVPGHGGYEAKASNQATQILTACQAFESEYGALPPTSENYRLIKILCGDNPRKIEFIVLHADQLNPRRELVDPWGTPFRITFGADSKVHVISAGLDKIFGTPDDIGY